MAQYIDKDAIMAEIKRRKKYYKNIQMIKPVYESNIEDFNELLSFLDTIEAKEVDLEKEATEFVQTKEFVESKESPVLLIAKHFYELGLKAQKGE